MSCCLLIKNLLQDEAVITPFGELLKSNGEEKVHYMKPKLNKYDMEFLNQIAAINSLTHLVLN